MLKKISPLFFLLFSNAIFSQNTSGELGILVDNDLFSSTVNDQYYTNGIEIFYRFLNQNENQNLNKRITEFQFGQYHQSLRERLCCSHSGGSILCYRSGGAG